MTAKLNSNSTYKYFDVSWLGDVPKHWEVRTLRHVLRMVTIRNHAQLPLLSVVREKGVVLRDVSQSDENHNFIPDDLSNYKVVSQGFFAINKMKAWQGSYGVSVFDGIVSPAYFVFSIDGVYEPFFHASIRSQTYIPYFMRASDGVRIGQWDLSLSRMREIPFAIPPIPEQTAIVRFLNHIDRRIQRYIQTKQKLLSVLEEQKQAVIHQAVTGQIDVRTGKPYPAYKPSGVKWLGDVPEHWEVMRLRNVAEMRVSNVDKHVKDGESPVRLCNYVDVYNNDYINKHDGFMHATATNEEIERFRLERDDVLITKDSETWDDIGVPALVTEPAYDLISGYHLALLRSQPDRLSGAYLLRALQSKGLAYQFHVEAKGVTRYGLSHGGITSVWLPLPSSSEQTAIVRILDDATVNLDKAVAHTRRQIDLIQEYRTRLIADVVTGKVDVRGIVDKLPDMDSIANPDVDGTIHDGPGTSGENQRHMRTQDPVKEVPT